MIRLLGVFVVTVVGFAIVAAEPETKGGVGRGELKSTKNINNNKNTMIEVLSPGEEKPRKYFVNHDAKLMGPPPKVLDAVRHAKVGDMVEFDWVQTNHGPAITAFKVTKKADAKP